MAGKVREASRATGGGSASGGNSGGRDGTPAELRAIATRLSAARTLIGCGNFAAGLYVLERLAQILPPPDPAMAAYCEMSALSEIEGGP